MENARNRGDGRACGRLLVTGATGFIGARLCERAREDGMNVRRALRHAQPDGVHVGDIGPETDWTDALADVDTVVHLAARVHVMKEAASNPLAEFRRVNSDGTVALARQAVQAGVRRLVLVSSIKVNGESTHERPFTAEDPPQPRDAYAISKAEAEERVRRLAQATGLEVVIIRPPLVYGPGVKGNFERLMKLVHNGAPLPLGSVMNRRSLVGRENLADFILTCIKQPQAAGETFLISDGEDLSTPELITQLGAAMGRPARLISVPAQLLTLGATLVGQREQAERLCGSLQIDSNKTRELLNWKPPTTQQQELQKTVDAYLDRMPQHRDTPAPGVKAAAKPRPPEPPH